MGLEVAKQEDTVWNSYIAIIYIKNHVEVFTKLIEAIEIV